MNAKHYYLHRLRDLHDRLDLRQDVLGEVLLGRLLRHQQHRRQHEGDHGRVDELLGEGRDHAVQADAVGKLGEDGGEALVELGLLEVVPLELGVLGEREKNEILYARWLCFFLPDC